MRPAVALTAFCVVTLLLVAAASVFSLAGIAESDSCQGCTRYETLTTALWAGSLLAFAATCVYGVMMVRNRRRRRRG